MTRDELLRLGEANGAGARAGPRWAEVFAAMRGHGSPCLECGLPHGYPMPCDWCHRIVCTVCHNTFGHRIGLCHPFAGTAQADLDAIGEAETVAAQAALGTQAASA